MQLSPSVIPYHADGVARKPFPARLVLRQLRIDRWTGAHVAAAAIMGLLGVLATLDVWRDIGRLWWKEPEYSHIVLVPFVALWMVFVRRMRFRHCKPVGTTLGFLLAGLGWCVTAFGFYGGHQVLWHAGAVLLVVGCVLSVLGKHALFRFFPAVAVLVFLIPVPPHYRLKIATPLQAWTAQISQAILDIFGVAVERSGSKLSINGEDVNIVEACNGLRMVFPLFLVSYVFSFGLPLRNSVRFLFLLASPVSAIACNVIRIVPTVWLYGKYPVDPLHQQAFNIAKTFHDYSGWAMLVLAFLLLLGIFQLLRWAMIPVMKFTLAS